MMAKGSIPATSNNNNGCEAAREGVVGGHLWWWHGEAAQFAGLLVSVFHVDEFFLKLGMMGPLKLLLVVWSFFVS